MLRVSAVVRLGWLMCPRAPSPSCEEGDPSGLMGSSCELLSCVDAPSAYLHSCKVSSRTKRSISTRGTPALRHGRARKLGAARGEHVRFLANTQCVGVPAVHAALLLAAPPALSHRLQLCTHPSVATTCTTYGDPQRRCWCIRDAETYTRYVRSLAEPGGSAARAIVLCGKGSSCQRWR
jgi:hypothetical protein